MRIALYLRRSTDEINQPDSIDAQDALLREWAATRDLPVVASFADSASGRTADRPEFHRLVDMVTAGAPFEGVLVRDVSRWGRFQNIDESAFWEFYFLAHGVKVLYAQETFRDGADDPFAALQKALRRFVAAEHSREKGRLLQYGKFRTVSKGFWKGGAPPYGFVRVLVTRDRKRVGVLQAGERKALNDQRVTLEIDPAPAAIVRRIFTSYVRRRRSPFQIAKGLNRQHVSSPRGGKWTCSSVSCILANASYAGFSAARFAASANFPTGHVVRTPGAWPGLVSVRVFERAEAITQERMRSRTPHNRDERLRAFFEQHGTLEYRIRGGRTKEWFLADGASSWNWLDRGEAVAQCKSALAADFRMTDESSTVVLNEYLRVGFAVSTPRGHAVGGVEWCFVFDGSEKQDMTVAIGLGPDLRPAAYFIYVNMRWRKKARTMAPRLAPGAYSTVLPRTWPEVLTSLRSNLLRYSTIARDRFLTAVSGLSRVNTYAVARALGWNEETGRAMYYRLKNEGVPLPPLAKQYGKRILIICDDCGRKRVERVGDALQWQSSLCRPCFNKRRRKYETCRTCGRRRALSRRPASARTRGKVCLTCGGRLARLPSFAKRPRDARGRYVARKRTTTRSARRHR